MISLAWIEIISESPGNFRTPYRRDNKSELETAGGVGGWDGGVCVALGGEKGDCIASPPKEFSVRRDISASVDLRIVVERWGDAKLYNRQLGCPVASHFARRTIAEFTFVLTAVGGYCFRVAGISLADTTDEDKLGFDDGRRLDGRSAVWLCCRWN